MTAAEAIVTLGRFRIDALRRVLFYDGKPVPLQHRAFDLVEFLAAHPDRFVARDEIETHVWHGQAIGENNLRVQMSLLRRALLDCGAGEVIVTRPGVGYRFVGEISENAHAPTQPNVESITAISPPETAPATPASPNTNAVRATAWRTYGLAATLILLLAVLGTAGWKRLHDTSLPPPPRLSMAVLPFRNLSDGHSQDYMADAITDDLTTDLSHIPGSVVIARESAEVYGNRGATAIEIGQALHVRYLLEGSMRAEEGSIYINARLVDASTGGGLWAERFDTKAGHLAEARNAIVRRIASGLDVSLTDIEAARSQRGEPSDADAEDMFLRARSILEHGDSLGSYNQAQQLLEQATVQQPGFGAAWAELALALAMKLISTDDPEDDIDRGKARAAVAQALSLVPHNAVALSASARLQLIDGNCDGAASSARDALQSEPNSLEALAVMAKCAMRAGNLEQSIGYNEEVLRLNPESPQNKSRYLQLAQANLMLGRYGDAIAQASSALEGDPPTIQGAGCMDRSEYGHLLLIAATDLSEDKARARDIFATYDHFWPNRSVWRVSAYVDAGLVRLPGYKPFLAALNDAGMTDYADESVDDHVTPAAQPIGGGDFDPTPTSIPGANAINTAGMIALLKAKPSPIVLDIGRGEGVIPGAAWNDPRSTIDDDNVFIDRALQTYSKRPNGTPIVVMGTGTYGASSYDGALHVEKLGYRPVYWYRGGEEAWVKARQPSEDRRPK